MCHAEVTRERGSSWSEDGACWYYPLDEGMGGPDAPGGEAMRATLPMVLLVMLAEVSAAQAESAAAKVRGEIAASFAKGEFEVAVKKADLALKKATEAGEQAQLHVLRAQALLALGQAEKAKAAFIAPTR